MAFVSFLFNSKVEGKAWSPASVITTNIRLRESFISN